jgi:hypothetical protein
MFESTAVLISVFGLLLTGITVWAAIRARPTRSIAHVIHDVETDGKR